MCGGREQVALGPTPAQHSLPQTRCQRTLATHRSAKSEPVSKQWASRASQMQMCCARRASAPTKVRGGSWCAGVLGPCLPTSLSVHS